MARRKKTREKAREIQEKAEQDALRDFEAGTAEFYVAKLFYVLRSNIQTVLIVGGGLLLLGAGAVGFWAYKAAREDASLEAFQKLSRDPVLQASTEDARKLALEKLDEYRAEYPLLDSAAHRTALKKLDILVASGRDEEAAVESRELARELDLPELRAYFFLKSAVLYENVGQLPKALEGYERANELILVNNEIKAFALFGQGRCLYLLGRDRDARVALESLLELEGEGNLDQYRLQAAAFLVSRRSR